MSSGDLVFPFATAPEIVRANQKDSHVESVLKDNIETVVRRLKGSRFVHEHAGNISRGATGLYLVLTTLLGSRTLGEEYCDLYYTTESQHLPALSRRVAWIALHTFGGVAVSRYAGRLRDRLVSWLDGLKEKRPSWANFLTVLSDFVGACTDEVLLTAHLAIFYFFGSYYSFSKRVTGMRYSLGHRISALQPRMGYEFLGILMVVQLISRVVSYVAVSKDETPTSSTRVAVTESVADIKLSDPTALPYIPEASRRCTLCLEYMTAPTTTLCGHLFCWTCVCEWCREKPECPLCRQACLEQNLLPLR